MKSKPIVNFAIAGLNTDLIPWDLPPDFLTDIKNIRIRRNKLTPFGGEVELASVPAGFQAGLFMPVGRGDKWLLAGAEAVYSYELGAFIDLTIAGGFLVEEDFWFGCLISSIPVINNIQTFPQYCPDVDSDTPMELLPWDATNTWADVNQKCQIIRSHKQFLFALGIDDGSGLDTEAVRWSAPADTGGVPPTWDELDTTSVAGLAYLGGAGGSIIDGLTLRDAFVVYRERGITVFDYVGGSFVWQIRHLSTNIGAISPNCIVDINGSHYFIGDGDIYLNDGNAVTSILHNRIRVRFATSFDSDSFKNSYAVSNHIAKEIWFCIPSPSVQYPDTAFIFNWEDDTWTIIDMMQAVSANYGPRGNVQNTWDTMLGTWDSQQGTWDQKNPVPLDETVLSVTKPSVGDGSILSLDNNSGGVDTPYEYFLERVGYALEDLTNVTTISRLYPHTEGDDAFTIEIGSQDYPGADVRWKPSVDFNVSTDRKVDIRTTGELHSFRISGVSTSSSWSLSGFDIEYTSAGKR